jgi:hypothetical protein
VTETKRFEINFCAPETCPHSWKTQSLTDGVIRRRGAVVVFNVVLHVHSHVYYATSIIYCKNCTVQQELPGMQVG